MNDGALEERYRREFSEMGTLGLSQTWDEPMPDFAREILLAELKVRRYRIKSLPEAPDFDAADVGSRLATPQTLEELNRDRVNRGVRMILLLGILQVVVGLGVGWLDGREGLEMLRELSAKNPEALVTLGGEKMTAYQGRVAIISSWILSCLEPVVLGLFFIVVYLFARSRPRLGLTVTLGVYLSSIVISGLLDPGSLLRGLGLKGVIIAFLVTGLIGVQREARADSQPVEEC